MVDFLDQRFVRLTLQTGSHALRDLRITENLAHMIALVRAHRPSREGVADWQPGVFKCQVKRGEWCAAAEVHERARPVEDDQSDV